jgi:hypothetical protein
MGSLDPFPAGFKIWFGSLNFQATGNGYLMCLTNRNELHPWRSTGPGPIPATPATNAPAPAQAATTSTSTPRRRRRSGQRRARCVWSGAGPCATRHEVTRPPTEQRRPRGSTRLLGRVSPTECAKLQRRTPHLSALTWPRTRTFRATIC